MGVHRILGYIALYSDLVVFRGESLVCFCYLYSAVCILFVKLTRKKFNGTQCALR